MAKRFWTKHAVAAAVHTIAFGFLLGFAADRQPLADYGDGNYWIDAKRTSWEPIAWKFTCAQDVDSPPDCPDSEKQFYVEKPKDVAAVNIIALASFYVGWSALGHAVTWWFQRWHREIRYIDYTLTAPTMLVVLAATYGLTSVWMIINPVLLGLLMMASYFVERPSGSPVSALTSRRAAVFYVLIAAYAFVVSPILYGAAQITNESRHPPVDPNNDKVGYGTAPDFVLAFAVGTVLIFSCFIVPFAIDLLWYPLENREAIYITLSMVAKTTLHLWLGLTVIETAVSVGAGEPTDTRSEMDTLGIGLGGAAALVVGLGLLNAYGGLYDDSDPKSPSTQYSLALLLLN